MFEDIFVLEKCTSERKEENKNCLDYSTQDNLFKKSIFFKYITNIKTIMYDKHWGANIHRTFP